MKRIRKLTTAFLVIALLVTSLVSVPALAEDDDYDKVIRLAGASRYLTAVEVSKEAYEEGADTVIIAAGENFPDALAASALAGKLDAPILLAEQDGFRAGTLEEIERLGATKAIVLGGEKALDKGVVEALEDAGLKVTRIAGENRYETAALIAKEVLGTGKEVFLVNGDEPWDALAIGPVAWMEQIPVLLTKAGALRDETKAFLVDNGIKTVTILGGEKAVSAAARAQIPAGISVYRVAGANREATAIEIAKKYFQDVDDETTVYADSVVVASREKFADALVGGYFGGLLEAPIMLVYEKEIRDNVDAYLLGMNPDPIYILGGEAVVSKKVADELDTYGDVTSIAAIPNQVIGAGEALLVKVNGKWEMDADEFDEVFSPTYTLSFLYTGLSTGLSMADSGEVNTGTGTGKYAVEVSYGSGASAGTIPAGGALAKDFVKFTVADLNAIKKVTEFALYESVDDDAVKVGAVAMGDTVTNYVPKALKAETVGGKVVTEATYDGTWPTFDEWVSSNDPTVISFDSSGLKLIGVGKATLKFEFKNVLQTEASIVVNVGKVRVPSKIENVDHKVFTHGSKKFDFTDTDKPYGIVVLDQYGDEVDPYDPYVEITKKGDKTPFAKGLLSSDDPDFTKIAAMTDATDYTVAVYTPGRAPLGSFKVTTVTKGPKDVAKYELIFTTPVKPSDPTGPKVEKLDWNLLDEVAELTIGVRAYIKNALVEKEDLAAAIDGGTTFELTSSKPKVADFGELTEVAELTGIAIESLYTDITVYRGSSGAPGTTTVTLLTKFDGARNPVKSIDVAVMNTTPKIKDLKLKANVSKLKVASDGAGSWNAKLADLTSATIAAYGEGITGDMIASVTYFGGEGSPYAEVTVAPAYGGETFTFPALLVLSVG